MKEEELEEAEARDSVEDMILSSRRFLTQFLLFHTFPDNSVEQRRILFHLIQPCFNVPPVNMDVLHLQYLQYASEYGTVGRASLREWHEKYLPKCQVPLMVLIGCLIIFLLQPPYVFRAEFS